MKRKLILACLLIAILLAPMACSNKASSPSSVAREFLLAAHSGNRGKALELVALESAYLVDQFEYAGSMLKLLEVSVEGETIRGNQAVVHCRLRYKLPYPEQAIEGKTTVYLKREEGRWRVTDMTPFLPTVPVP